MCADEGRTDVIIVTECMKRMRCNYRMIVVRCDRLRMMWVYEVSCILSTVLFVMSLI